jgi:hypothetical protein
MKLLLLGLCRGDYLEHVLDYASAHSCEVGSLPCEDIAFLI